MLLLTHAQPSGAPCPALLETVKLGRLHTIVAKDLSINRLYHRTEPPKAMKHIPSCLVYCT